MERRAAEEAAERLAQQVAALIESASKRFQSAGDQTSELLSAQRDVNQALTLDPGNVGATKLQSGIEAAITAQREAAKVKAVVSNARARFANGKRQAAIRLLEEFQPASRPEIVAALNELRASLEKIEEEQRLEQERIRKQERLASLFGDTDTAIREHQFDAAIELLSSAAEIDADAPELVTLRERVRHEQAAVALEAELVAQLADLDEHLAAGDWSVAADLLAAATTLAPADPRVARPSSLTPRPCSRKVTCKAPCGCSSSRKVWMGKARARPNSRTVSIRRSSSAKPKRPLRNVARRPTIW